MADPARTVNEQFLVEVHDTTAEELTAQGISQAAALLDLNRLFTGWVETVYHPRVHTETEQTPLARWAAGWERTGRRPQVPGAEDVAEAFRWAQFRSVTKTATVSLLSNTYQVDPSLTGRRVELVFDPFDMTDIAVNHHGKSFGKATPHTVTRHSHPKARPETVDAPPAPTGIDYLNLVAGEHHGRAGQAINFHALTGTPGAPPAVDGAEPDITAEPAPVTEPGQVPGQLPLLGMPTPSMKDVGQQ